MGFNPDEYINEKKKNISQQKILGQQSPSAEDEFDPGTYIYERFPPQENQGTDFGISCHYGTSKTEGWIRKTQLS